jgi:hypothetical protein
MPTIPSANTPSAKPQDENPMLDMIRAIATFDPHRLVEAMQKRLPKSMFPGFDMAGWTAMQEKNMAALQAASRQTQAALSDSAKRQLDIMRECIGTAVRATEDASRASDPYDATAKEVESAFSTIGNVPLRGIEALKVTAEKLKEISNQLGRRCVDSIAEMKKMAPAPSA